MRRANFLCGMWKEQSRNNSNSATTTVATTYKIIQEGLETNYVANKGLTLNNGIRIINCIEFEEKHHPFVIRISEDNEMWAIGFENGIVGLYPKLDTSPSTLGCAAKTVDLSADGESWAVTDVRFFHSNKKQKAPKFLIATYASGYVRLWDFGIKNRIHQLKKEFREEAEQIEAHAESKGCHYNTVLCCSVSYDNKRLVTGGSDCGIRVYDAENLVVTKLCQSSMGRDKMDGHVMKVCAVKYHPLGAEHIEYTHTFLSGGWDDVIMIWDDRSGATLWQYYGTHICGNDALDILQFPNMILGGNWNRETPLFHVYEFHVKCLSNEDAYNPTAKYIKKEEDADKECKPVYSLTQNSVTAPSMPYVTLWLTKNLIVTAGSNNNCFNIINWKETNICAAVRDFEHAIYSVAFKKPARSNLPYVVAFVTGKYVYVMEFATEITSMHVKQPKLKERLNSK